MKKYGFTLIELMIVVAIIALLAALSIPSFTKFIAKSKRAEAYMNLHALYAAQKAFWAEHGKYASQLNGADGLGWKPDGYRGGGENENFYYTYGFSSGSEGQAYVTGKLKTPASALAGSRADTNSFLVYAAGDIDGDGRPDILSVDENNMIKIVQDDLAD